MAELSVTITDGPNPAAKVTALVGEMDESSLETVKPQLDPIMNDANVKYLILDLTKLSFINSKGIGYLVSIHTHLSKDQRELILAGASEEVMDVISLVGLTTIVKYFNTLEEATASLGA
jgi:anti-anti-sigma factor